MAQRLQNRGRNFPRLTPSAALSLSLSLILVSSLEARPRNLRFVYSTAVLGETQPCGCAAALGGLARRATHMEGLRKGSRGPLLAVDGGDLFFRNYRLPRRAWEDLARDAFVLARSLSPLSVAAAAVGETDLALGLPVLERLGKVSDVPLLCANLTAKGGRRPFESHLIWEEEGVRVALFSVLSRGLGVETMHPDIALEEPLDVARALVPKLREKADFVVLLGHLPEAEARKLVERVPGIDIAVQSQGKTRPEEPKTRGGTLFLTAGNRGQYLGRVELTEVDPPGGAAQSAEISFISRRRPKSPRAGTRVVIFEHHAQAISKDLKNEESMEALITDAKEAYPGLSSFVAPPEPEKP